MGSTRATTVLLSALMIAGCAEQAPPNVARTPTAQVAAVEQAPSPKPAPPALELGGWIDLDKSPGAPELERGAAAAAAGDWRKARTELEAALPITARLDTTLAAHGLLGRACAALEDEKCASTHYDAILASWHGKETADEVLRTGGVERLQRSLLAVAEALFFDSEQKRIALERVRMPLYKGESTQEGIDRFVASDVKPWIAKKQGLVEETEAAYGRIGAMEPASPPGWRVDAAARVAQLWGRFNAETRAAPVPPEWSGMGSVPGQPDKPRAGMRVQYFAAIDGASAPLRKRARKAYERCQAHASAFGHHDDLTRSCDAWLRGSR